MSKFQELTNEIEKHFKVGTPESASKQHLEQPAPEGAPPLNLGSVTINSKSSCTIHPLSGLVNYPVCQQLSPNPCPVSCEDALRALNLDYGWDDYEAAKVTIIINLVELKLMMMSQNPTELARFLPMRFSEITMAQLDAVARQNAFFADTLPLLLNAFMHDPELQKKITPDLLYNSNMKKISIDINLNDASNSQASVDLGEALGWDCLHYPFLYYALISDSMVPNWQNFASKAFSLAPKLGINTEKAFTEIINLNAIPFNRKFAYSTTDFIRPHNMVFYNVYGEHGSIRQVLYPFYGRGGISYLPVTAISCQNEWPKMMFLPQDNMPLIGLSDLLYRNDEHIVLTPRIHTAVTNCAPPDTTVLSWWGGADTIDLVDWSPLVDKKVQYLTLASDFGGNIDATLQCMHKVVNKLTAFKCRVELPLLEEAVVVASPSSQYPATSCWQQNNQVVFNSNLYG